MGYRQEVINHFKVLDRYAGDYSLPPTLFESPDHIAFTAADISDFSQRVRELAHSANQLTVVEAEDRFVATAKLSGMLTVGELGRLNWVSVIEPTDADVCLGTHGISSLGYHYPDVDEARLVFARKGIFTTKYDLPVPSVHVPFLDKGINYEIGFYELPLEKLVQSDIDADRATFVRVAPQ